MTNTTPFDQLPAIGATIHGGAFAGITTQPDGTHVAVVLLPDRGEDLTHDQATTWAAEQGGQLPTRPVAALLFANVQSLLQPEWHWCRETFGASYAWGCDFYGGTQDSLLKSHELSAVAVRRYAPVRAAGAGLARLPPPQAQ